MGTDEGREAVGENMRLVEEKMEDFAWNGGEWERRELHCVLAALLYNKSHRGVERTEF